MNVYLIYKVLREISNNSRFLVEEHLAEGVFRHSCEGKVKGFAHYVMEKF
jgi:hypothetical protein